MSYGNTYESVDGFVSLRAHFACDRADVDAPLGAQLRDQHAQRHEQRRSLRARTENIPLLVHTVIS